MGSSARVEQILSYQRQLVRGERRSYFTFWELQTDADLKRLNRATSYTELLILFLISCRMRSQKRCFLSLTFARLHYRAPLTFLFSRNWSAETVGTEGIHHAAQIGAKSKKERGQWTSEDPQA